MIIIFSVWLKIPCFTGNGKGGESIYGPTFASENFEVKHDRAFILSMANRGPNTNSSQFFILTGVASHLDGSHVAFGHVVSGHDVVLAIEKQTVDDKSKPYNAVCIVRCGELIPVRKTKQQPEIIVSEADATSAGLDDEFHKQESVSKKHEGSAKAKEDAKKAEEEDEPASMFAHIDPSEIPEVPSLKFLDREYRRAPRDAPEDAGRRAAPEGASVAQHRDFVTKSGRRVRGRGAIKYRTPSRSPERRPNRSPSPPPRKLARRRSSTRSRERERSPRDDRHFTPRRKSQRQPSSHSSASRSRSRSVSRSASSRSASYSRSRSPSPSRLRSAVVCPVRRQRSPSPKRDSQSPSQVQVQVQAGRKRTFKEQRQRSHSQHSRSRSSSSSRSRSRSHSRSNSRSRSRS